MKVIVELEGCRTRIVYNRAGDERAGTADARPCAQPDAAPEAKKAKVVTDHARPLAPRSVPLAWTRGPDARASIPVGPCLPRPPKRYFEARHGHHVRVRCRLSDADWYAERPIVE